jgi:hypothetical protein
MLSCTKTKYCVPDKIRLVRYLSWLLPWELNHVEISRSWAGSGSFENMLLPSRSPPLGQPGRYEGSPLVESDNPPVRGRWRYLLLTQAIGHAGESRLSHGHNRAPSDTYLYGPHKSNWGHSIRYKAKALLAACANGALVVKCYLANE